MNECCGIPFSTALLHPKHWLVWCGLALTTLVSLLPTSARHVIGRKVGAFIYKNNKKRRHIVACNLRIAFPDLSDEEREEMALAHFHIYGCAIIDYSVIMFSSSNRLSSMSTIQGKEHIDLALQQNERIILLIPHSVMLEFLRPSLGAHYEIFGFYKTFENPVIDWIVARSRCRQARLMIPRKQGLRKLLKSIAPGRILCFFADEDLGLKDSVFAPFFGKSKSTLATSSRLAKMTKSTALPAFVYFDSEKQKYTMQIGTPLNNYPSNDLVEDATVMNDAFKSLISESPEQYMWTKRCYRTRPDGEAEVY